MKPFWESLCDNNIEEDGAHRYCNSDVTLSGRIFQASSTSLTLQKRLVTQKLVDSTYYSYEMYGELMEGEHDVRCRYLHLRAQFIGANS